MMSVLDKRLINLGWRLWGLGGFARRGSFLSRGSRTAAFFIRTHSQRETWGEVIPCPTGLLTARVLVNGGSALPRVSTCLLIPRQVFPGIVRLLSHRLVSAEPRALTATRPPGHSLVLPHLDVRHVYLVDSFIVRDPQYNVHTTSLILTLSGHTFSG